MDTLPAALQALATEGAAVAGHLAYGIVSEAGKSVWNLNKIQHAAAEYLSTYLRRHGLVKVLGMPEPMSLREIYTDVNVVSRRFLNRFRTVDDLERSFRAEARHLFDAGSEPARDAIEVANKTQYLTILGAPGAGKSTLLRRMGLEALLPRHTWADTVRSWFTHEPEWSRYEHDCLPILIELRRFRREPARLLPLIRSEFEACGFEHVADFILKGLKNGRFLILFDGLDEVPNEALDRVVSAVRDFVDTYPANRYVVSCRTAFYKTFFNQFTDVVIADFGDDAIRDLVARWFASDEDRQQRTAENLWRELKQQPATLELARTPLLLTFICIIYDRTQGLPSNRTALYRRALEILLERWAAEKRVHNEPIYRDLHPEVEIEMLADFAGPAFKGNRLFFSKAEIVDAFSTFLATELNSPRMESHRILEAIEVQQGLLVSRANDVYSFSHLTIQEYLAAHYFRSLGKIDELVSHYLLEERWREVFVLLAGQIRGDDLARLALSRVHSFVREDPGVHQTLRVGAELCSDLSSPVTRAAAVEALLLLRSVVSYLQVIGTTDFATHVQPYKVAADRIHSIQRVLARAAEFSYSLAIPIIEWDIVLGLPHRLPAEAYESTGGLELLTASDRLRAAVAVVRAAGFIRDADGDFDSEVRRFVQDIAVSVVSPRPVVDGLIRLTSDYVGLSEDDLRDSARTVTRFNTYLHGVLLLCEFRRTALRMSPETWLSITTALFEQ